MAVADSLGKISRSIRPAQVTATLEAIEANWPTDALPFLETISNFPLGEEALFHLLSVSSICGARLIQHPEILLWLAHPDACADRRGFGRMLTDLHNLAGRTSLAAENFRILRFWKGREMVRIALREISGAAPLEETLIELSQLADICLTTVYDHWNAELRQRWGSPESQFAIIGLGKLGGRELNHSSDVDLIFVYRDEGQLTAKFSYHEWFTRLGNKVVETFATSDPAGSLFRVDLRLRPEGRAGPLVRSLESMENYYAGFGEMWERLALIKARWICGDRELAYDFLRQLQPFIFPKSPTPDLLDEVAAIKLRIERDIVGYEHRERNVKLGAGASARSSLSCKPSSYCTRRVIRFCRRPARSRRSAAWPSWNFCLTKTRATRDRLSVLAAGRTSSPDRGRTANPHRPGKWGSAPSSGPEPWFRRRDRSVFEPARADAPSARHFPAGCARRVTRQGFEDGRICEFRDEGQAAKNLAQLGQGAAGFHVAPRTRQIFRKLRPLLLTWLGRAADPDATLTQFVRFVEAYGFRSLLFELLTANPRLLELLVRTLDASETAGGWLIRRPQWLEELTRSGMLDRAFDVEQHLERLQSLGATSANLDPVRIYRQRELLRILLRDVLRLAPLAQLLAEQNDLAESCLIFTERMVNP